jgi:hypothetical protein
VAACLSGFLSWNLKSEQTAFLHNEGLLVRLLLAEVTPFDYQDATRTRRETVTFNLSKGFQPFESQRRPFS